MNLRQIWKTRSLRAVLLGMLVLCFAAVPCLAAEAPESLADAALLWNHQFGEIKDGGRSMEWHNSPTPPLVEDGYIYTVAEKTVYKMDASTGEIVDQSTVDLTRAPGAYTTIPLVHAGNYFLMGADNGQIIAIDDDSLEQVWITDNTAVKGNQTISPISIVDVNGTLYGYSGTWTGETKDGSFFAFTVDDANVKENANGEKIKSLAWTFTPSEADSTLEGDTKTRGFYWSGVYGTNDYVAFGSEDGSKEASDSGAFYTVNPTTGEIISQINGLHGDLRGTPQYKDGFLYFGTTGGMLYKVGISADGQLNPEPQSVDLGGAITADPLIDGNRLYVGVASASESQKYESSKNHHFDVVNIQDMTRIGKVSTPGGFVQKQAVLVKKSGKNILYFLCNSTPGGIYSIQDNLDGTFSEAQEVYMPRGNLSQYCISPLTYDAGTGTFYYKNDSTTVFAVGKNEANLKDVTVTAQGKDVAWDTEEFDAPVGAFALRYPGTAKELIFTIKAQFGTKVTVAGKAVTGDVTSSKGATATVALSGQESIEVVSTRGGATRTYTFHLEAYLPDATLEDLMISTSNTFGSGVQNLTEAFQAKKKTYVTEVFKDAPANNFYRVWMKPSVSKATVEVLGKDNVDHIVDVDRVTKGYSRVNVYPKDLNKSAIVTIRVTAEDGETIGDYTLTLARPEAPKKVTVAKTKLSSLKAGKKSFTAKWKKVSGASGYELLYSTSKKFSGKKTVTIKKGSTVSKTVKKLKAKKTYYVKIRAYRTVSGKKVYGAYSDVKKIKVKK